MKFDKTIAIEIIKKHNLSSRTLKDWKYRDVIPDKYFRENYRQVDTIAEDEFTQRIRELLGGRYLHASRFRSWSNHPNYKNGALRGGDVISKGLLMTQDECDGIKSEIVELRNKARYAVKSKNIEAARKLFSDKRVNGTQVVGKKLLLAVGRNDAWYKEDKDKLFLLIGIFYNTIKI